MIVIQTQMILMSGVVPEQNITNRRAGITMWCRCGKCKIMQTEQVSICCRESEIK